MLYDIMMLFRQIPFSGSEQNRGAKKTHELPATRWGHKVGNSGRGLDKLKLFSPHSGAGERRNHVSVPLFIGGLALTSMAYTLTSHPEVAFVALLVAMLVWAPAGIFHSYPAGFLQVGFFVSDCGSWCKYDEDDALWGDK